MPMTGVQLQFDLDPRQPEAFHLAVQKYHELVSTIAAAPYHGVSIAEISNTSFLLTPLTLPYVSRNDAETLMAPLVKTLRDQRLNYSMNVTESPTWLDHWLKLIEPNPTQLVQNAQYGGWMVPRELLDNRGDSLLSAIQEITEAGPWPNGANLDAMHKLASTMTQTCVPALSSLAPSAGAYLKEAGPNQPDWKEAFHGPNYQRLLTVKERYDPNHIFYGSTAVGSDYYEIDNAGRLCRTM
ncbi:hypothetical protein O1611_g2537 [Lasiodiplodia mahajangana]|uniref:Uncharacterized protein n=1 Tax=Lasiodiplodia mahajangana TaxID=1108764 RepID=A0ACC2JU66_9PEZI|nr:hypothetical protein O1611_g2537 [Lasiodiplodia mahajangana]